MATIRLCDWSKKRLAANEITHKLVLMGKEYEISSEAAANIRARLEDEHDQVVTSQPVIVQAPVSPQNEDIGINAETTTDPFASKAEPGLLDEDVLPPPPTSVKERLPTPTRAQAERVVRESRKFAEGGLPTLSPGAQRNLAAKKLAARETTLEQQLTKEKEKLK